MQRVMISPSAPENATMMIIIVLGGVSEGGENVGRGSPVVPIGLTHIGELGVIAAGVGCVIDVAGSDRIMVKNEAVGSKGGNSQRYNGLDDVVSDALVNEVGSGISVRRTGRHVSRLSIVSQSGDGDWL